ncbi:hypothetical protein AVEN_60431-1 [Araneus ventricosus]|uniref:Uncharacterized protein n=1 Tax=Araneus ventricosus TaxID=182803 RepID=A0A4Y2U587_ARAVE|nr:hypothetical protein AVEN_60431-1 [Araneus ventricosus]
MFRPSGTTSLGVRGLTSRFEATRRLFWDHLHYFKWGSDDEDDTLTAIPSPTFPPYQREKDLGRFQSVWYHENGAAFSSRNLSIGASKGILPTAEWRSHSGLAMKSRFILV